MEKQHDRRTRTTLLAAAGTDAAHRRGNLPAAYPPFRHGYRRVAGGCRSRTAGAGAQSRAGSMGKPARRSRTGRRSRRKMVGTGKLPPAAVVRRRLPRHAVRRHHPAADAVCPRQHRIAAPPVRGHSRQPPRHPAGTAHRPRLRPQPVRARDSRCFGHGCRH